MKPTNSIRLFGIDLKATPRQYEDRLAILNEEERERASRFKFEKHRYFWVSSRAALRTVLAQEVNCQPTDITFTYRADGKPELLLENLSNKNFFFNLSHSHEKALIAVSDTLEVGCDIEYLKKIRDRPAVSRRFFSPREQMELEGASDRLKDVAFYLCWTRKEAVIKTTGQGLRADLQSFDVSLTPGRDSKVYTDRGACPADPPWHLFHVAPFENYVGAVATRSLTRPTFEYRYWQER